MTVEVDGNRALIPAAGTQDLVRFAIDTFDLGCDDSYIFLHVHSDCICLLVVSGKGSIHQGVHPRWGIGGGGRET